MFRRHISHTMRHYNSTFNVLFDYCNNTTELFLCVSFANIFFLSVFDVAFVALTLAGAPTNQTNKSYSLSILITPYLEKHKRRLTCCAYSNSKSANEFAQQIHIDKRTSLNCIRMRLCEIVRGPDCIDKINLPPLFENKVLYRYKRMCCACVLY